MLVARFKPDRSLDTSWAGTGYTVVNVTDGMSVGIGSLSNDSAYAGMVDGTSLFVCGTGQALQVPGSGVKVVLAKFLADGSLDTTFGNTATMNGVSHRRVRHFAGFVHGDGEAARREDPHRR